MQGVNGAKFAAAIGYFPMIVAAVPVAVGLLPPVARQSLNAS